MREMKDSGIEWIGSIPLEKTVLRNKYMLFYEKGKIPISTNTEHRGKPYIGASDLDSSSDYNLYTEDDDIPESNGSELLVLWDGARAGIAGTHKIGMVSSTIVKITGNENVYQPFLYWYYMGFVGYMMDMVNGTTIPHMNRKYIEDIGFINWTISEQKYFTDYLDHKCAVIDNIIAKQEQIIEKLKEYKLSLITEAVTKGLDPNVEMKDSAVDWIGNIPSTWTCARISNIATVVRGASPRPAGDPLYFNGHDVPWITVAEVTKDDGKYIEETETFLTFEGSKQSRTVEAGTLLLSNSGATLGVPKITHITGCINDGSVAFLDLKINQDYLYYILKSRTFELRKQMQGYGQPNLNTTIVKSINIPMPTESEQCGIVEYLDKRCCKIDHRIDVATSIIDKYRDYKKSLIYEVVTGKKEV